LRLATPDLEFDHNRSKLRDPRSTSGRYARPHYEEDGIPEDILARLKKNRTLAKPNRPKGRLSSAQRQALNAEEAVSNTLAYSLDLFKCLAKDKAGSPAYDDAGFSLDYDKA
jgi:hypothetical protein